MGRVNVDIDALDWGTSDTNPADIEEIVGANGKIPVVAFDDTTEEEVQTFFKLPATLDPDGNVTFEFEGFSATATGLKIRMNIEHSAKNAGEVWDAVYNDDNSGDLVTDAAQDEYDYFSFMVSVADLLWAANDLVRLKQIRVAIGGAGPLIGDWYNTHFRIRLPTL